MKKRNINLDLIRMVAIFSVISVHFFKNIGFYEANISGFNLSLAVFFRTLFMICVPLFLILTGFLMNKKILSKKYYFSIFKVLFIFLSFKCCFILFNYFYYKQNINILTIIRMIFNYSNDQADDYTWYVNMYFGLFLLIPFLNLIYNNLKNKKQKQVLILTLFFLTSLVCFNVKKITLIPNWWAGLYPLMYYFIGAYIKEFGFNFKMKTSILSFFLVLLTSSLVFLIFSYNRPFFNLELTYYAGPSNIVLSILVFGILLNLNTKNYSDFLNKCILKISEVSFGMYLFSFIVDCIVYEKLNILLPNISDKLVFCFFTVPLVLVGSFILSVIFTSIYNKFLNPRIMRLADKY